MTNPTEVTATPSIAQLQDEITSLRGTIAKAMLREKETLAQRDADLNGRLGGTLLAAVSDVLDLGGAVLVDNWREVVIAALRASLKPEAIVAEREYDVTLEVEVTFDTSVMVTHTVTVTAASEEDAITAARHEIEDNTDDLMDEAIEQFHGEFLSIRDVEVSDVQEL